MAKRKQSPARPKKIDDLMDKVHSALKSGLYRDTRHSKDQKYERDITLSEIIEIFENGFHESNKDEFREDFQDWNYAIRGTTFEGRDLRVPIYFEEDLIMIVTVMIVKKRTD